MLRLAPLHIRRSGPLVTTLHSLAALRRWDALQALLHRHLLQKDAVDPDLLYSLLPALRCLQAFQTYRPYFTNNQAFVERFIDVCCDLGDVDALVGATETYLRGKQFSSARISRILATFGQHYHYERVQSFLAMFCARAPGLDELVLHSAVVQLAQGGALFTVLIAVLRAWVLAAAALPSARTMAVVLNEAHKYGSPAEIQELQHLVFRYDLAHSPHIQLVQLKYAIIHRHKFRYKKEISTADLTAIARVCDQLYAQRSPELPDFYHDLMKLFILYGTQAHMELLLGMMGRHHIGLTPGFYTLFMLKYRNHEQFLELCQFLKSANVAAILPFSRSYVDIIIDTFIRSFPHFTESFYAELSPYIDADDVLKVRSKFRPFYFRSRTSAPSAPAAASAAASAQPAKKSFSAPASAAAPGGARPALGANSASKETGETEEEARKGEAVSVAAAFGFKPLTRGKKDRKQVQFRVEKGFPDMLERGVRPDNYLVEETFRAASLYSKTKLLEMCQTMRMQPMFQNRLSVINLSFASKEELATFWHYRADSLDANNMIPFARLLHNKKCFDLALEVYDKVPIEDLNNNSRLYLFVAKLRTLTQMDNGEAIARLLDAFPFENTVMNRWFLKQLVLFEREDMRDFIGTCKQRLADEEQAVHQQVRWLRQYLDAWAQGTPNL